MGGKTIRMKKQLLIAIAAVLASSAYLPSQSHAQAPTRAEANPLHPLYTTPEFDSKLVIGGLAITVAGAALLIENRRRRKASGNV